MARKKQYDYFASLNVLAENSAKSALLLQKIVENFSQENLMAKAEEIHDLERAADRVGQEIMEELYDAFITPIDREDIVQITNALDDILDEINATTYLFENLVITTIRPETDQFINLVMTATSGTVNATKEFAKFKNSKTLQSLIDEVNATESEADRLYSRLTKELFTNEKDPIEIIKWRDIYNHLELIVDGCEKAVDIIQGLVIKNS